MRRLLPLLLTLLISNVVAADDPAERFRARLAPEARLGRAMVVQPAQPLTDADRAALAAKGIHIKHALAGGRYLARVRGIANVEDARIASIRPLTTREKIHTSALRQTGRGKTWMDVHIVFQRDVDFEDARDAVLAAGGALREPFRTQYAPSYRLRATIAPASLDALASDERVLTVVGDRKWRIANENAVSSAVSDVDEVQAAPYGLTGAGVNVSLFELAAAQQDHVEFGERMTVHGAGGSASDRVHATHVAGTIGASGVVPAAKGMAPNAIIYQHCIEVPANQCESNDWLSAKEDLLPPRGVRVDNNSWAYILGWSSEGGFNVWLDDEEYLGAYDLLTSAVIDEITNKTDILFVHSAGNEADGVSFGTAFAEHRHVYPVGHEDEGDTNTTETFCYSPNGSGTDCPVRCSGPSTVEPNRSRCETTHHQPDLPYDTIGMTAAAKNILAVGSIVSAGPDAETSDFSSRGPAKDGRLKPDVVARGSNVFSSSTNNRYTTLSGTSMASPVVTGIAALLVEQWRRTFGGANPTAAQLKALIIAGTEDLGNPGPDFTFGFGLVNAKNSVDTIIADNAKGARIRNHTIAQGQTVESSVLVTQQQNLRVVLNWPDPSVPYLGGDDIAQKALVNDLDVKVIGPNGATHLPWRLDRIAFRDNATRGVNTIDNIEMVEIPNAAPGVYRVVVTGTNVAEGPQKAVVVTSASAAPPCVDPQETGGRRNDTAATAVQNLVSGAEVRGAICTNGDIDFYTFTITRAAVNYIDVTNPGDTEIRAGVLGPGISTGAVVSPGGTTRITLPPVPAFPAAITLFFDSAAQPGIAPNYSFTPVFGQAAGSRRRSVGR